MTTQPLEVRVRAGGGLLDYPVRLALGLRAEVVPQLREVAPKVARWVSSQSVLRLYRSSLSCFSGRHRASPPILARCIPTQRLPRVNPLCASLRLAGSIAEIPHKSFKI